MTTNQSKWFQGVENTMEAVNKFYRKLAKKHHPDMGGDTATMQEINNEYERLINSLKHAPGASKQEQEFDAYIFQDLISKLIRLDGLEIEICGIWLWVGGNTRQYKEQLKSMGFNWSSKKKLWYKAPYKLEKGYRSKRTMEQNRSQYGSTIIKSTGGGKGRGGNTGSAMLPV